MWDRTHPWRFHVVWSYVLLQCMCVSNESETCLSHTYVCVTWIWDMPESYVLLQCMCVSRKCGTWLRGRSTARSSTSVCCSVLQCVAVCCRLLQCVAALLQSFVIYPSLMYVCVTWMWDMTQAYVLLQRICIRMCVSIPIYACVTWMWHRTYSWPSYVTHTYMCSKRVPCVPLQCMCVSHEYGTWLRRMSSSNVVVCHKNAGKDSFMTRACTVDVYCSA